MTTTLLPSVHWIPQQRAWSLGGIHAAIIGQSPGLSDTAVFRVLFWDGTRTAVWPLANTVANTNGVACAMLADVGGRPGVLVVAFKSQLPASYQQTFLREYAIPTDPFASAPGLIKSPSPFGDAHEEPKIEFVFLPASKALICCTHQHAAPAFDSSVRTADGIWRVQARQSIKDGPTGATSYQFGACWAPWGDLMWIQDQTDGGHQSDGATFAVVNGFLARTATYPAILNGSMGVLACNQEIPSYCLVSDPARGQVCASYTNTEFVPGIDQMAYPVIAGIRPGVAPVLVAKGSEVIVSILNWSPVIVQPSKVTLTYVSGRPQTHLHCDGNVIELKDNQFAAADDRLDFVIRKPDGQCALVRGDAILPPDPIPVPDFGTIVAAPQAAMSWSADDPTGSNTNIPGKYMLQWSTDAIEPRNWQDMTDHWPATVQAVIPATTSGKIVRLAGIYYRLRPVA